MRKPAAKTQATGSSSVGTRERPWALKTPPGTSEFEAFRDETLDPPALVVRVGKTELRYHLGVYVPPVLEVLGLAEVEHLPKNNRMRARSP